LKLKHDEPKEANESNEFAVPSIDTQLGTWVEEKPGSA